jgi:hypothetical protein
MTYKYKGYEIVVQYCTNTVYQLDDEGNRTNAIEENDDYLDYYRIVETGDWDFNDYPETLQEAKELIDSYVSEIEWKEKAKIRLAEIKKELELEQISYNELQELDTMMKVYNIKITEEMLASDIIAELESVM